MIDHGEFERFETPQKITCFGSSCHRPAARQSTRIGRKDQLLQRITTNTAPFAGACGKRLSLEQVGALGGYLPPVAISAAQV
ncbi:MULTISPECIES: hypothetical protein [Sinorhizobium]|uniref:hypothetical protein n=1 Tax=Sinorhizobium TaxID=28105 RepID=UPI00037371BC|nr:MULTISPECIES: hypothetical protein [Sinorhizobium]PND21024.1 hypothetical protein CN934_15215 [Ensifer sp. MMN_5]